MNLEMIRSMTGFGRGTSEEGQRSFTVEVKSVNHRYLDLNIKMPRSLAPLEDRIRKKVQKGLNRGKVDIFITQNVYEREDVRANFNSNLGDSYFQCLKEIRDRYKLRDDISVSLVAKFPDVIYLEQKEEDVEIIWESLQAPLDQALSAITLMREKEGLKLKEDILNRCGNIKDMVDMVEKRAPLVIQEYKQKLETRINDLLSDVKCDENRIAAEIAIFADRASIDEEIVRLNSHIIQIRETLDLHDSIGRKLDFIVQEMNREANTIGSKANDLQITNTVLDIKSEIEKIREQVQNLE